MENNETFIENATNTGADASPALQPENTHVETMREETHPDLCPNCGSPVTTEQCFCPNCGAKLPSDSPVALTVTQEVAKPAKNSRKKMVIPIVVIAAVITGVVLFFVLRGTPVEKVKLTETSVTLEENQFYSLKCTITPKDATDKTVTWKSSDSKIAKVNKKGQVTALKVGECTISATSGNGKTAECKVTVEEAGPDLQAVYAILDDDYYCEIGYDGSYLEIDTNPYDIDDGSSYTGALLVQEANELLGLPDSVWTRMTNTNALGGVQNYTTDKLNISWSYHPDNGLEVIYERVG